MTHPDPNEPYRRPAEPPLFPTPDRPAWAAPPYPLGDIRPVGIRQPGPPPRKKPPLLLMLALAVTGLLSFTVAVVVAYRTNSDRVPFVPKQPPFEKAMTTCNALGETGISVRDDGKTLLIDTKGTEDIEGANIVVVACLLGNLDTPAAVIAHIDSTRALDGRQRDAWPGYTASWSYHPDNGMDMVIQAK